MPRGFAAVFKVTVGELEFGIQPARGLADTGRLQQDLPDLFVAIAEAAAERNMAIGQKHLRAMAELGPGPHKTGAIAATLGVEAASVATVRQQLIDKGMIWSQRHGETAFTVPMFDAFMRRQMPTLEKHVPRRRPNSRSSP